MMDKMFNDSLLATKFYVPPLRTDSITRQRLVACLYEGVRYALTLICAPAGSGKTTLLSEWFADTNTEMAYAWLSLDKDDNEPVRFWQYILAALSRIGTDVSESLGALQPYESHTSYSSYMSHDSPTLANSTATSPEITFIIALINAMSTYTRDIVLVLDDYHLIQTQAIHDAMAYFIEHLPSNVHLVIATRTEPPLPLARLRVRQQLIELRADQMRFSSAETLEFLSRVLDTRLSRKELALLEERTEGWISGLQLAALSLRGRKDISTFLETFTGSHRYITDYLVEEVLSRLPEQQQTFLLNTSILDRLTAPLCDALTESTDSQKMLEQLEQANIFLVPLDDERHWYRYHHLFAEMLFHRLQRTSPECVSKLHQRASQWYEAQNFEDAAIEHALRANDYEHAALLIERKAGSMMSRGEMNTLQRWFEALPDTVVRTHYRLSFFAIWTLLSCGQWDTAESLLQDIEREQHNTATSEVNEDERQSVATDILAVRAALTLSRGNVSHGMELLQQILQRIPRQNFMRRSYLTLHLAMSYWLSGNLIEAERLFIETCDISKRVGHFYITFFTMYNLAEFKITYNHLHQAHRIYDDALRIAYEQSNQSAQPSPAIGVIHLGLGNLLYEWNMLHSACEQLTQAVHICKQHGDFRLLLLSYYSLARVYAAQHKRELAREMRRESEQAFQASSNLQSTVQWSGYLIDIALALGDTEEATRIASEHPLHENDEPAYLYEIKYRAMAKLLIAQGHFDEAILLLHRQIQLAESESRTGSLIKFLVLLATVLHAQGDSGQAVQVLTQALSLAEPEGYIRTFIDEGESMATLLLKVQKTQRALKVKSVSCDISSTYIQTLLNGLRTNNEISYPQPAAQSIVEPLSEREREILHLIASGLSNQAITERLIIAMSTLKTHINHIYAKLDVRSRTQAIVRARALDLL